MPKNRGPDQRAPVIARAIADSDIQRRSRQANPPSVPMLLPSTVAALPSVEDSRVEITLADGICVRVGPDVGLVSLRRIVAAVRR